MALKLRLALKAIADLDEIHAYLVARNPRGADRVRIQIDHTIHTLTEMAGIGRRTHIRGVRSAPVKRYPYVVYYRATDRELFILHVRHGARAAPTRDEL